MKTAWSVINAFLVIHVLAALFLVAYLGASGRLSRTRITSVYEIFKPTLDQESQEQEMSAQIVGEAQRQLVRLKAVEAGPHSAAARLQTDRQAQEVAAAQLDRYKADIAALRSHIETHKQRLNQQKQSLELERKALDDQIKRHQTQQRDSDFQRALQMYERVKPKQAKQMFQALLQQNQVEQVLEFLAAMNARKAAAILGQFKSPAEIDQATMLLEQLRARGIQPPKKVGSPPQEAT